MPSHVQGVFVVVVPLLLSQCVCVCVGGREGAQLVFARDGKTLMLASSQGEWEALVKLVRSRQNLNGQCYPSTKALCLGQTSDACVTATVCGPSDNTWDHCITLVWAVL